MNRLIKGKSGMGRVYSVKDTPNIALRQSTKIQESDKKHKYDFISTVSLAIGFGFCLGFYVATFVL